MSRFIRHGISLFIATAPQMLTQYVLAAIDASPAQLPEGYVNVPGGYARHQSCIHEVPSGSIIDAKQKKITLNGAVIGQVEKCNYPRIGAGVIPMLSNSTHTFAFAVNDIYSPSFANFIYANLTVPVAPSSGADHWFALWTGMQDGTNQNLIQPTLQWSTVYETQYVSSSVYCGVIDNTPDNDNCYQTTPFLVYPGDQLQLYINGSNCTSQGTCGTWIIETYDPSLSPPYGTYLELDNFGFTMSQVFGGVFEMPGSDPDEPSGYLTASQYSCSDFPNGNGGSTLFSNIVVYYGTQSNPTSYYYESTPSWSTNTPLPPITNCTFSVNPTATSVRIGW